MFLLEAWSLWPFIIILFVFSMSLPAGAQTITLDDFLGRIQERHPFFEKESLTVEIETPDPEIEAPVAAPAHGAHVRDALAEFVAAPPRLLGGETVRDLGEDVAGLPVQQGEGPVGHLLFPDAPEAVAQAVVHHVDGLAVGGPGRLPPVAGSPGDGGHPDRVGQVLD